MQDLIDALRAIASGRFDASDAPGIARDALEESGIPVVPDNINHAVVRDGMLHCDHCGAHYRPNLPCSIRMMAAMMTQFSIDHAQCKSQTQAA